MVSETGLFSRIWRPSSLLTGDAPGFAFLGMALVVALLLDLLGKRLLRSPTRRKCRPLCVRRSARYLTGQGDGYLPTLDCRYQFRHAERENHTSMLDTSAADVQQRRGLALSHSANLRTLCVGAHASMPFVFGLAAIGSGLRQRRQ
jgi:hypothetical protein